MIVVARRAQEEEEWLVQEAMRLSLRDVQDTEARRLVDAEEDLRTALELSKAVRAGAWRAALVPPSSLAKSRPAGLQESHFSMQAKEFVLEWAESKSAKARTAAHARHHASLAPACPAGACTGGRNPPTPRPRPQVATAATPLDLSKPSSYAIFGGHGLLSVDS